MLIIGIAGGSGSGKTTFAKKVVKPFQNDVSLIHIDSYYKSPIPTELFQKGRPNFDHPQSFDWNLLLHHLELLIEGKPVETPVYDFKTNSRTGKTSFVNSSKVIIVEGIFALYNRQVRDLLNVKCFLSVDSDIRFSRRLNRDLNERGRSVDSVLHQYYETVRPMHLEFLEPQKKYADIIIGEENEVASNILRSKIRDFLTNGFIETYASVE